MAKRTAAPAEKAAEPANKGLNLAALKKVAAPAPKAKANERPVMELPEELQDGFVQLVEISTIKKVVDSQYDNQSTVVKAGCFDEFVHYLWRRKVVPANPKIEIFKDSGKLDHSGIYQVRAQFKVDIPEPTDEVSGEDLLLEALTGGDGDDRLDEDRAIELIKTEIDLEPTFGSRTLNELLVGHYEQKNYVEATPLERSAGEKLQAYLLARAGKGKLVEVEALTDDEAAVTLKTVLSKKVKDASGFLARVCGYCRTEAELRRVFAVIQPYQATSSIKFADSDTLEERNLRLQDAARRVIGMTTVE